MGTTVATLSAKPPENIYQAAYEEFEGLRLLMVHSKHPDGGSAFVADSLEEQSPEIRQKGDWLLCLKNARSLLICVGAASPRLAKIVTDIEFYSLMVNMPGWNTIKKRAVVLLTKRHRGELDIPEDVASHPAMMQIKAIAEATMTALRAEQRALRAETKADDAFNLAEISIELQTKFRGRLIAVAEITRRGWRLPQSAWTTIGKEMRAISLRLGDDPANYKRPWNGLDVNTYREEAFDIWEKECGPNYQQHRKAN